MDEPMNDEQRRQRSMERSDEQDTAWIRHEIATAELKGVYHEALASRYRRYLAELEAIRAKYTPE